MLKKVNRLLMFIIVILTLAIVSLIIYGERVTHSIPTQTQEVSIDVRERLSL